MGQSVRTKSSTTSFPVDGLNGSTGLPSRFSADALGTVCGTLGSAANPQNKTATQIIMRIGICKEYITAGNASCKQPQFYTLRRNPPFQLAGAQLPFEPHDPAVTNTAV